MATFYEDIPEGLVLTCYGCHGPVREAVYHHQCDIRITPILRDYCFSCMAERNICKRCHESYTKLFCSVSLRNPPEIIKIFEQPPQVLTIPIECVNPQTHHDKERAKFYCLLAEYLMHK